MRLCERPLCGGKAATLEPPSLAPSSAGRLAAARNDASPSSEARVRAAFGRNKSVISHDTCHAGQLAGIGGEQ